jgi:hypothetical protein
VGKRLIKTLPRARAARRARARRRRSDDVYCSRALAPIAIAPREQIANLSHFDQWSQLVGLGRRCKNIELRTVQFFASQLVRVAETETVFGTFRAQDSKVNYVDHGLTFGHLHCEQLYRRPFYVYGKSVGVLYL